MMRKYVSACFISLLFSANALAADFPTKQHITDGVFLEPRPALPALKNLRPLSHHGLRVTEEAEGWSAVLYNDSSGYCTIGYGHLLKKARCNGTEPVEFRRGITRVRGETLLSADMAIARAGVSASTRKDISDNQYAALCDFVFNVGTSNYQKSGLRKTVNATRNNKIPIEFRRWTYSAGNYVPGLLNRRNKEIALYFEGSRVPSAALAIRLSPLDILTGRPPKK